MRYALALGWTVILLVMLLQSSAQPVVGPAAPPGDPDLRRELVLTAGHLIGFSGLTLLWWWAFRYTLPNRRAVLLTISIALVLGVLTEYLQTAVADRNTSLFDLVVNIGITLLTGYALLRRIHIVVLSRIMDS